jgi:hypothetical protein
MTWRKAVVLGGLLVACGGKVQPGRSVAEKANKQSHHDHSHLHPHSSGGHHHHSHPHPHLGGLDGHHHSY